MSVTLAEILAVTETQITLTALFDKLPVPKTEADARLQSAAVSKILASEEARKYVGPGDRPVNRYGKVYYQTVIYKNPDAAALARTTAKKEHPEVYERFKLRSHSAPPAPKPLPLSSRVKMLESAVEDMSAKLARVEAELERTSNVRDAR